MDTTTHTLSSALWILAFMGYGNALTTLVMYSFNLINFKTNKAFWLATLIPGYLLYYLKSSLKIEEEKLKSAVE